MQSPEFKKQYERLNKKQKEAVDTIEGPVMVIAGPGTGKTTVLTLRIAQILEKTDVPPSGILAITYTDAGVKAMRQKLRTLIGARADEVRIHTFHNFAISVIRDYPDHFPHISNSEPITEIEQRNLVQRIIEEKEFSEIRPIGRPDLYVDPILSSISESKKEAYTPEMIKSFAEDEIERIKKDEGSYSTRGATKGELKAEIKKKIQKLERSVLFSLVYEKYENLKREEKKIDFDDMIFELEIALRRDELLLRLLQENFLYLLVDEHQDTNDSQNMLILMIAEFFDTPNVFIVGDEKQAIYRFQGASVENFLKFQKVWRDVKIIQLETSYRTHQKILDASFNLIEKNYEDDEYQDLRVELKTGNQNEGKEIISVVGKNITDSEEYLVEEIKNILRNDEESNIALIVRTNAAVSRLKRLCESRGIESSAVRNVDIFSHPIGKLFFNLLRSVYDPLDIEAFSKTILAGLWGFKLEEQIDIVKQIRSKGKISEDLIPKEFKNVRDSIYSGDPLGFLFELATSSGYVKKISSEPERVEIWRGIIEFSENVLRSKKDFSDTFAFVEELLEYDLLSERKQVKIVSGDSNTRVKIMTAHGSKGLEFDYVFVMYATESFWMKKGRPSFFELPFEKSSREEEIKDSRRLFYVSITRAKSHVEIISHEELEGGETDLPLRFIEELGENNISLKRLSKANQPAPREFKSRSERVNEGYLDAAKRVLTESGLSVTALNHFLECPNKFLYKSVLRVPELPNASSEKGNAMHHALAYIFKSNKTKEKDLPEIIKKKAFEYLDKSVIPFSEKEILKQKLEEEIPVMTDGLISHFQVSGQTKVEQNASSEVEVSLGNKNIKVPLHGRLDLVVENNDGIEVFDYKTKKAMTDAEIKGDTKNSDGGYFRQLVFYVLLLSSDPKLKNRTITPSLIFLTPDQKGKIKISPFKVEKKDLDLVLQEIKNLSESVFSGEILSAKCDDLKCEWCGLRDIAGF